jgi:toluene monooxygenase system protein A
MTAGQVLPQRLYEGTVTMPKLERSEWYDLCRDMYWCFKYVTDAEVFPEALSQSHGIPASAWWSWDEPYKISYREYVHNQAEKDAGVYSVRSAMARSRFFENLDPGWKAAIIAHYGAITMPEYLASIGEARMGRFGRAAAWRNMALYGTLDETQRRAANKQPRRGRAPKPNRRLSCQ